MVKVARSLFVLAVVMPGLALGLGRSRPGPKASASPAQILKVLSLNFNAEAVPQDPNSVLADARFKALVDWAHVNDPDVILLQEGWNYHDDPSVSLTLARTLGYDVKYRISMGGPGVVYSSEAVLAKKKFKMHNTQELELPHSSKYIGNGQTWVLVFGPVTFGVGATLTLDNGEPAYLYTSHLVGDTDDDRRDQIAALDQAIVARVQADGGNLADAKIIVGGDLNSMPGSAADQFMIARGYLDAWEIAHPGDPGMTDCSDPTQPEFNPLQLGGDLVPDQSGENSCMRIDHLYSHGANLQTLASTVVFTAPIEGVWMSDHNGLFSTFGMNGQMPTGTPNPSRDNMDFMLPTHMLHMTKQMFYCDGPDTGVGCGRELAPFYVVGPRGITIQDDPGCGFLDVRFRGPGHIYSSYHASLDNNGRASFVFSKDGDYTYVVTNSDKNTVSGRIHVVTEAFINNPPKPIK